MEAQMPKGRNMSSSIDMESGKSCPHSAGIEPPAHSIPEGACDCHHHIYDPDRFAYVFGGPNPQPASTAKDYSVLKERLGLSRSVIVQPFAYGTDNRCTLDAVQQLGPECTRAIAVIDESFTDEDLAGLHAGGVRGIRFNLPDALPFDADAIYRLAKRVSSLGWSVHFWMNPDRIAANADLWESFPCPVVFDHRGHIPTEKNGLSSGEKHPAIDVIADLIQREKAWVKLSGIYLDTSSEDYADTIALGRYFVNVNAHRCLWGTDWPHPTNYAQKKPMPNDAAMLDALWKQAGDEETVREILVKNPETLFFR